VESAWDCTVCDPGCHTLLAGEEDRMAQVQGLRCSKRHQTGSNNGDRNCCLVVTWNGDPDSSNRLHGSACGVLTHSGESPKAKQLSDADQMLKHRDYTHLSGIHNYRDSVQDTKHSYI
jgi:hypothetical protein